MDELQARVRLADTHSGQAPRRLERAGHRWCDTTSVRRTMVGDRKTISIMKACELVGVSRRTIYNWIASRKVEYVRTAGGSVRIFVDTLWRDPAADPANGAWTESASRKEA
jgi:excisionase family DNA binding protein